MSFESKLHEFLPEIDFGVLGHGFMPYSRDYYVVAQIVGYGVYRCIFTHCVLASVETRVRDSTWSVSWKDEFIDYDAWENSGNPDGFVWGTNCSLAYPGLRYIEESAAAADWSERIGRRMNEVTLETEVFFLRLICHDIRKEKLSEEQSPTNRVLNPLPPRGDA